MFEVWSSLLQVFIPSTIQILCLSLLAWIFLKQEGTLPFELAGCFAVGVAFLTKMDETRFPLLASTVLAVMATLGTNRMFQASCQRLPVPREVLAILFALMTLVLFEFLTDASPVSANYPGTILPLGTAIAITCASVLLNRILHGNYGPNLRLGKSYTWVKEAWLRNDSRTPRALFAVVGLCWWVALTVPTTTIGVASHTIFRDVTIAVLIARAVGLGHPINLLWISCGSTALKLLVSYQLAGPFGSLAGDLATLGALSLAIAWRTKTRTD